MAFEMARRSISAAASCRLGMPPVSPARNFRGARRPVKTVCGGKAATNSSIAPRSRFGERRVFACASPFLNAAGFFVSQ